MEQMKKEGGHERNEKERGKEGGVEQIGREVCLWARGHDGLQLRGSCCCGVGVSLCTGAERETTEDVFFLAGQECPGLEVFPLLVCLLYQFMLNEMSRPASSSTLDDSQCYTDA
ncbi:unnamed protein product [Pleuronectes platessa]|uniref:Uncharacterized protein n=1 Tax=Pleuronectes platessa TaxID=8262 RepID=A0A9N7UIG5_PLEPL|nr:unnamed protein product [Pleuronectes platessa]